MTDFRERAAVITAFPVNDETFDEIVYMLGADRTSKHTGRIDGRHRRWYDFEVIVDADDNTAVISVNQHDYIVFRGVRERPDVIARAEFLAKYETVPDRSSLTPHQKTKVQEMINSAIAAERVYIQSGVKD